MTLAGCAALRSDPAPTRYVCDDGKQFSVVYRPEAQAAIIEIDRMRFGLRQERAASGEVFSCDVLTLRTVGREALLEIQGERTHANCREADE